LLFCFLGVFAFSQNQQIPKTDFTKMYLPVWEEATKHYLAIVQAMPDTLYSYKPSQVSKTFGEQMEHIAAASKLLTKRYVEGLEVKPSTPDASKFSKIEIIKLLQESFVYTKKIILTIEQKNWTKYVPCIIVETG